MRTAGPVRHAALGLMLVIACAACGGDDEAPDVFTVTSSAAAAASSALSAGSSAAAAAVDDVAGATDDCAEAALSVRAALASAGSTVTDVKVIGQCTGISVSTTLTADKAGSDTAKALCTTAGAEAYGKGVGSVSVDAADGTEIAIGLKEAPCIGPFG